tara:strand:- start:177641 stop:178192 length:552 start_codon:yes stop_codon:yes gene_type:complete
MTILVTCSLSSCIHNRENNYLQSYSESSISIPKKYSDAAMKDAYAIPEGPAWSAVNVASYGPPGSLVEKQALAKTDKVKPTLTQLGVGNQEQPALLVREPFNTVWPKMNATLKTLKYTFVGTDKAVGLYVVKSGLHAYQFNVQQIHQGTVITVKSYEQGLLTSQIAKQLLTQVQKQIQPKKKG